MFKLSIYLELCLHYPCCEPIDNQEYNESIHQKRTYPIDSLPWVSNFYILQIAVKAKNSS